MEPTVVHIGYEEVEVWPRYCARKQELCLTCYLEGKIPCRPPARSQKTDKEANRRRDEVQKCEFPRK